LEKALVEYKEKFQSLADNSNVAIAATDKRGRFTYVNHTLTELLGYSTQELIGTEFKNYLHPDDRGQVIALFLNIMVLKRQPRNMEFRALHKDGTIINLISKPSKLVINGKNIGFLAIILDITKQKRIEEELRKSESNHKSTSDFLNNILSNMLDYVFVIDENYTISYINESAKKVYGNLIGQKCYKATRNLDQPCHTSGIDCEVLEVIHKGNNVFDDTRKMDLSGRIAHVIAKPIKTSGNNQSIIVVVRDVTEEKKSKANLEESLSLLGTTFESTADGILVTDLNREITKYNQRFVEILKIPKHILKTRNDDRVIEYLKNKMKDPEDFVKRIEESFSNPEVESRELLEFDDGRLIERYTKPQRLNEEVIGRVLSFRDITKSKKSEKALIESEEKYRLISENTNDMIAVMTFTHNPVYKYVSPSHEKNLGWKTSDLLGKSGFDFIHPKDKLRLLPLLNKYLKKKITDLLRIQSQDNSVTINFRAKDKLGNWHFIESTINLIKNDLLFISRDITERKRMEEELKHYSKNLAEMVHQKTNELAISERLLQTTIENVPDHVYVKSRERDSNKGFKFIYVNDSYSKFHNKTKKQIVGRSNYSLYQKEQANLFTKEDAEVFNTGKSILSPDTEVTTSNGDIRVIQTIKAPIKDKTGLITHIIGITRDLTERKHLEKMKDQFISAVTHELRTPLVSIKAYVDYPLTGKMGQLSEEMKSNLTIVKRNTDRLLQITGDLLELRRMESGKLELNKEPMNFQKTIDHCIDEIRPLIKDKKQSIDVNSPNQPLIVNGDSVRLSQVLMNLLSNANKFTPEGGKILLNVKVNQKIHVELSDTGIGIKKQDLKRVFEPFSAITKPTYIPGTGLGLSVTKGMIEAHGGKIWANSQGEGKGSTFTFELPRIP
jgi:PAS domain S-box-containing protein